MDWRRTHVSGIESGDLENKEKTAALHRSFYTQASIAWCDVTSLYRLARAWYWGLPIATLSYIYRLPGFDLRYKKDRKR